MSSQPPDNINHLLGFIATTVETMRDQMVEMRDQIVETHDEMMEMRGQMATKSDLEGMATKSDLARLESKMEAEFAVVRGDIEQVQLRLDSIERARPGAPRSC